MIVVLVRYSFHLLQVVITALETTCYYFKSFFFFGPSRLQNLKLMLLTHSQKVLNHSIIFRFTKMPKILMKIETFEWIV